MTPPAADDAPRDRAGNPLCILSVHAHPDDEASKGAGTIARYAAEGIRGVLVCCTGGEEGDILNPAADTPEVRADLGAVRMRELDASVAAIGYASLHLLGYRDSGMPDTEANARPENFANAPLDEAVERLVRIIRAERPQVIITYGDDHRGYQHPDHIRVHEITVPAFDAAGDPDRFPDAGDPWQPSKLYYSGFSFRRIQVVHDAYVARGEESPYEERMQRMAEAAAARESDRSAPPRATVTTLVDVGDQLHVRRAALLAHRTQIDPESHWMRVPDDLIRTAFPWDEYELARSLVDTAFPLPEAGSDPDPAVLEDDLFAGVRVDAHVAG